MSRLTSFWPWAAGVVAATVLLSGLDPVGPPFSGWYGYAVVSAVCAGLVVGTWRWVAGADRPRWLALALGAAVGLRILVGWGLEVALPIWGYDEPIQRAGYVFYDASKRDNDAWALAASDKPLTAAFSPRYTSDQYGTLLFVTAGMYRGLGEHVHRPLMVVELAATVGALAVVFTWAFTGIFFGARAGAFAAWVVALYPEAVLLGASQMREPFIITGLAMAFFGFARAHLGDGRGALAPMIGGTLLCLAISPPFGVICVLLLTGVWLWDQGGIGNRPWVIALLFLLVLAALALTFRAWSTVGGLPGSGFVDVLTGWFSAGSEYQLRLLEGASGIVQYMFKLTPKWAHLPLATAYGVAQPFLPAALTDPGAAIWRVIAIFRALGWYALMPFLAYAAVASVGQRRWRHFSLVLVALTVIVVLAASFRVAGDQWDNPRYRTAFIALQAALAGWGWSHALRTGSPWLRRFAVLLGGFVLIFVQWYMARYYGTPGLSLLPTLALEGVFVVGYLGLSLTLDRRRRPPDSGGAVG
jgi:hypothetical protein